MTRLAQALLLTTTLLLSAAQVAAQTSTNLPLSLETSNSLVQEQFPITIEIGPEKVFLTEPEVVFLDAERIAIRARFQAFDHRPADRVAISEMGSAQVSGSPGFDPAQRQFLIHNPRLDTLVFDEDSPVSQALGTIVLKAWHDKVGNPLRADVPVHPYLGVMKDYISGLAYDGQAILLQLAF